MVRWVYIILIFIFLVFKGLLAQDKILLISGREIPCEIIRITDFDILYRKLNRDKEKRVERDGVYSVNFANGNSVFIYRPHAETGDEHRYSYKDMRLYIVGEQDAKKGFKTTPSFIAAAIAGLGGSTLTMFYGPLVPATFSFVLGLPNIRVQPPSVSNPNYLMEEPYVQGYSKAAKVKKIQALVKGSIAGFAAGTLFFYITPELNPWKSFR